MQGSCYNVLLDCFGDFANVATIKYGDNNITIAIPTTLLRITLLQKRCEHWMNIYGAWFSSTLLFYKHLQKKRADRIIDIVQKYCCYYFYSITCAEIICHYQSQ